MAAVTVIANAVNTGFLIKLDQKCTVDDAIKASVDGTMPTGSKKITINGEKAFSFRPFTRILYYGRYKYRGVAYTKLTFDQAGKRTIGIGAGNFFTLFVNGKKIATTEPGGNFFRPVHATNYVYQVEFKKGDNHVAIFTRPGAVGWELAFNVFPDFSALPKTEPERNRLFEQLCPPPKAGLVAPECIFNVSTNRAEFCFETGLPAISAIRYRKAGSKKSHTVWNSRDGIRQEVKIHRIALNALQPDTKYEYEVIFLNRQFAKISVASKGSFTTFPAKGGNTGFMLLSDTQSDGWVRRTAIKKLITMYGGKDTDFFVSLGDVSGVFNDFRNEYFTNYYDELGRNQYFKPAVFVRGNHEFRGREIVKYNQFFGKSYYAFRHGDVFFIVLESGEDKPSFLQVPGHYTMTTDMAYYFEEQRKWLGRIIETPECKTAKYRVVLAHASPVSCDGKYMARNIRRMAGEYFYGENPKCPIHLWIAGHTHAPSFFDPQAGKFYQAHYYLSFDKKTKQVKKLPMKAKREVTQEDKDIRFPVLVNDGPAGTGAYISGIIFNATPQGINVKIVPVVETYSSCRDNTVKPPIFDATLTPGKPAKINSTTLEAR